MKDYSLWNVVVLDTSVKLADERLSLQSRQTRLGARSCVLVDQFLGGCLVERLYNKAEFLVGGFLGRLFSHKSTELLDPSSQSTALMAVSLAANERLTK